MKIRLTLLVLWIILALSNVSFPAQADNAWQAVGEGIDYQEFHLPEPNDIYVARMDRANASAILDSGIAQGRISHGTEKVSDMARRYDDAINYWGGNWGQRNKVVVAINGSYFNAIGAPESGQITSGWYAKRFGDLGGGSGLGYRLDRSVFIGQCVLNKPDKQVISIFRDGQPISTFLIDGLNIPRGANQLIVYTPQYDDFTHTAANGLEVLVEMKRPTLILPLPASANGLVDQILDLHGQTLIPFDHIVLSASGTVRDKLLGNLAVGDEVHISQEITPFDKDCERPYNQPWTKTYASIGGAFNILRDGQIITSTETGAVEKDPRTAIAYNDQYIFFIVVDGRNPQRSVGMTFDDLAAFAQTLGSTWAIAQDGGGSSVMVVNGQVKNHPVSLCDSIFLPILVTSGLQAPSQAMPTQQGRLSSGPVASTPSYYQYACERPVANSMMMIQVQPAQSSQTFHPLDLVSAQGSTEIRLGPGTNYPAFASIPSGTHGFILTHNENLNGIGAKGSYWWKVAFGDLAGWVDERAIVPRSANPLSNPHRGPTANQ